MTTNLAAVPEPGDIRDGKILAARVRALCPFLQEQAPLNELNRSLTAEAEAALRTAGLFDMLVPHRWRGAGLSLVDYGRVMVEIGKGDLAASWVVQIINTTTWVATLASDAVQETLFGEGPTLVSGVVNPPGEARRVDGGYLVSGRWPYSSGWQQADWMMAGVRLADDAGVPPTMYVVYLPMRDVTADRNWRVTGLQGTGSDTIVAEDVFVPDDLFIRADSLNAPPELRGKHYGAVSDFYPVMATGRMTNLAQLLGGAQQMLHLIEADVVQKPLIGTTYRKKSDSGAIVHEVGRIAARLGTAELILFDAFRRYDERAAARSAWTDRELAHSKAEGAQVVNLIHASIEDIMFLGGSSAFSLANPLQRYWRDIHIALRHILHLPHVAFEHYGRQRLGLKPDVLPPGAL